MNVQASRRKLGALSPLMAAATHGHLEIVQLLCDAGADLNLRGWAGTTALGAALGRDQGPMVEFLLQRGADPNALVQPEPGVEYNLLTIAASHGYVSNVEALLATGVNVNTQFAAGVTALMTAADRGHTEVVRLLLSKGADPRILNQRGKTAQEIALASGHRDTAQLLRP